MLRDHGSIAVNDPFGEAAQGLCVQSLGESIDGHQTPGIYHIVLLRKLMAAYSEINLVAETLLDASHDKKRAFCCAQLLLQVWLIEPGYFQLASLIRDSGNSACPPAARTCGLHVPDKPFGSSDLPEGKVGNFYKFAVIAMFAWKIDEQITHVTYAQIMQPCGHGWTHSRDCGNISA